MGRLIGRFRLTCALPRSSLQQTRHSEYRYSYVPPKAATAIGSCTQTLAPLQMTVWWRGTCASRLLESSFSHCHAVEAAHMQLNSGSEFSLRCILQRCWDKPASLKILYLIHLAFSFSFSFSLLFSGSLRTASLALSQSQRLRQRRSR
jgi:sorbitol-specific phosphotransferase system component IIA